MSKKSTKGGLYIYINLKAGRKNLDTEMYMYFKHISISRMSSGIKQQYAIPELFRYSGGRTLVLTDSLSKLKADSISKSGLYIYSQTLKKIQIKSPPSVDFLDIESALCRLFRHRVPWYILAPKAPNPDSMSKILNQPKT